MSETSTIREAIEADAPVLCEAERMTARTPGLLVSLPHELREDAFRRKIADLRETGIYLVAERDGAIAGHALLEPMPLTSVAHVFTLTIVVHPGHLGLGVGSALMGALLAWADRNPAVGKIELRVRETNRRALALYQRSGFVEEGRFQKRIRLPDGSYIADISMARFPARLAAAITRRQLQAFLTSRFPLVVDAAERGDGQTYFLREVIWAPASNTRILRAQFDRDERLEKLRLCVSSDNNNSVFLPLPTDWEALGLAVTVEIARHRASRV